MRPLSFGGIKTAGSVRGATMPSLGRRSADGSLPRPRGERTHEAGPAAPLDAREDGGRFWGCGAPAGTGGGGAGRRPRTGLRCEDVGPQRDVVPAFPADEEAGGDSNGPAFLLKEHRDLV